MTSVSAAAGQQFFFHQSAIYGEGIDKLREALSERITNAQHISFPISSGQARDP